MNQFKRFYILALVTLSGMMSACVAPTASSTSGAMSPTELVSIQQQFAENEIRVQRLQDSLVMLEVRLLDQQRLVENLRQQLAGGDFKPGAAAVATGIAATPKKSPTETYLAAFGDYAAGNYKKSIKGFSTFLLHFPANDYAGNARYWLAECYLAQEDYDQADIEFERVYVEFPQGNKAADALLKMAAAQYQSDQAEQAIETIQLLKELYPKSAAARRAEQAYE